MQIRALFGRDLADFGEAGGRRRARRGRRNRSGDKPGRRRRTGWRAAGPRRPACRSPYGRRRRGAIAAANRHAVAAPDATLAEGVRQTIDSARISPKVKGCGASSGPISMIAVRSGSTKAQRSQQSTPMLYFSGIDQAKARRRRLNSSSICRMEASSWGPIEGYPRRLHQISPLFIHNFAFLPASAGNNAGCVNNDGMVNAMVRRSAHGWRIARKRIR